ncbi:DNA polymerase III subunit delta [Borrelia anserina]|uniref:DNA-directed DNA polymerase n=2 Tax=Borrelia anserina TaxID=143 RepID=W5SNF7_BORAN|nr:DNA polymerase III subunit delta [Borrelia anserina]AHH08432.1 Putative cytosolic protein [Borrelia anserina BA2]APR64912.1 DNA polymerase III subunit delta [Borrelia anserina Es]UPA06834.1 DNA polymerase III subunit delta [Borrelia anserina]
MQKVYLLLGKEQGLKETYLNTIFSNLNTDDICITKLFLSELSSIELSERLLTNSFFSKKEAFIIYEAENLKNKEDLELVYNTILKSLNKIIIFVSNENTISFDPKGSVSLVKKIFYELSGADKFLFVKKSFFNLGIKITDKAVNLMLFMLDADTKVLQFYIRSFALMIKDKIIDEHDVSSWLSFMRSENPFSLFESILTKDMECALVKVRSILEQGEDLSNILMSLGWQFKKFLKVKVDCEVSHNISAVFKKHRIFVSLERSYRIGFKNYSVFDIKFILKILNKFDLYSRVYSKNLHLNLSYFMIFILLSQDDTILDNFSFNFEFDF